MTITASPLTWPHGWKRTAPGARRRAKFSRSETVYNTAPSGQQTSWNRKRDMTISDGTYRVLTELTRMGIVREDIIISTNVELRLDGLPRSNQRAPADPGVAVYWTEIGHKAPKVMAIDLYDTVADNLAAIAATLEAMRAIERHGGAAILDRAFTGFTALPSPETAGAPPWIDILWKDEDEPEDITLKVAETQYRRRRSETHPDKHGGDAAQFNLVQRAWEQAQQELAA